MFRACWTVSRRRLAVSSLAVMGLFSMPAQASGRLPPVPIPPRDFADFAACRAFLDETYQQDLSKADPAPTPIEGGTRQTLIESKGPVSEDETHANYEATEGWQIRRPAPEAGYTVISYSYRTTRMACDGGRLTGAYAQGYNLESYERQPGAGATP